MALEQQLYRVKMGILIQNTIPKIEVNISLYFLCVYSKEPSHCRLHDAARASLQFDVNYSNRVLAPRYHPRTLPCNSRNFWRPPSTGNSTSSSWRTSLTPGIYAARATQKSPSATWLYMTGCMWQTPGVAGHELVLPLWRNAHAWLWRDDATELADHHRG